MGVPGLFSWIGRNYRKEVILKMIPREEPIDHYYIDLNGLVHFCHERMDILMLKDKTEDEIEKAFIDQIMKYLQKVIFMIKPRKSITITVDGSVQMSKNHLKRFRREKSKFFKEMKDDLDKKYGVYEEAVFDEENITAGTKFMYNLENCLEIAIRSRYFGPIPIKLSKSDEVGEGEHKIIRMIKRAKYGKDERICLYCGDGDIVMLTLALERQKIFLMREIFDYEKKEIEMEYYVMDKLSDCIFKEMRQVITNKKVDTKDLLKNRLMNDFVFICFFLGNDFIHSLPSLSISTGGIEILFEVYAECFKEVNYGKRTREYILDVNYMINSNFFGKIIEILSLREIGDLRAVAKNRKPHMRRHYDSEYEMEEWKLLRVAYNSFFSRYSEVINYEEENWKQKYVELYFGDENMDEICLNYLEGIIFVKNLYFKMEISWTWYKPYYSSPFVSDLKLFLPKISINDIHLEEGKPLNLIEQLMIVLPKRSFHLLPKCLEDEMNGERFNEFYPERYEWMAWDKVMISSAEPKLPLLDLQLYKEVYERNREFFSEEDKKRDVIIDEK